MLAEKEIAIIQKATIYDIQKILDANEPNKTYTAEEIKNLLDAYQRSRAIKKRDGKPPQK